MSLSTTAVKEALLYRMCAQAGISTTFHHISQKGLKKALTSSGQALHLLEMFLLMMVPLSLYISSLFSNSILKVWKIMWIMHVNCSNHNDSNIQLLENIIHDVSTTGQVIFQYTP
jgi:hypothetical protein